MMKGFFRKFRLNNKGLTLLEAVIAILIISMVSVGVTSLFFHCHVLQSFQTPS